MRPAGLEQIELAKADGRWDAAYAPPSAAEIPPDLQAALDASPAAAAAFAALSKSNNYEVLLTIQKLKNAETRERRIADYIERLEGGEPLQGPRKKP
jgi:uncharacterized protein YdeI (YjbR/CyaY-like superfamily)